MALPTLDKTYQYARSAGAGGAATINKYLTSSGTGLTDQKTVLLQIVNDLLNFTNSPWTCIGSGDGAGTFGMAGVNLWTAISKLVFATSAGTAHSWIVLQQTGIAAKCQICIDLISPSATTNTNGCFINVILSPSAGFGTANGGANGTNTARPTATDEIVISTQSAQNFIDGGTSSTSVAADWITNVIQSTDGQVTRVWIKSPGGRFSAYFCVEKPKNPLTGWTNPAIGRWYAVASGHVLAYTNWMNQAIMNTRSPGGVLAPMYLTGDGYNSAGSFFNIIVRNELANEWEMYGIGLANDTTVGFRGRHGRLFDAYWVSQIHPAGTYFPSAGTRLWQVIGNIALPWNGSVATLA